MKKAHSFREIIKPKYIKKSVDIEYIYSAFKTDYESDFYFIGEFHQMWEMVYVISGSVGASGDDRVYYLCEGDVIFHKPMEFHRLWAVDDIRPNLFIMSFHVGSKMPRIFEKGVFSLNDEQKEKIYELMGYLEKNSAYEEVNSSAKYFLANWDRPYVAQNVANRTESFLLSFLKEDINTKEEDSRSEVSEYKKIITILSENVYTWISLDDVANKCNLSKAQIKRVFAKNSYIGIHKYFLKLKMTEAIKLLASGMTVSEVAEKLEFSSPNYFSMAFKKETGTSPFEYKKRL